jgi:hypothetical protein
MVSVETCAVPGGTVVIMTGDVEDPDMLAELADLSRGLGTDGVVIVDLSAVNLAPLGLSARVSLARRFGHFLDELLAEGKLMLVSSRLTARIILRRIGVAGPIFATLGDALSEMDALTPSEPH